MPHTIHIHRPHTRTTLPAHETAARNRRTATERPVAPHRTPKPQSHHGRKTTDTRWNRATH